MVVNVAIEVEVCYGTHTQGYQYFGQEEQEISDLNTYAIKSLQYNIIRWMLPYQVQKRVRNFASIN